MSLFDIDRQQRIKAGQVERIDWPGGRLQLSWEVWGETRPLRAQWLITYECHDGALANKTAFDDFDDAIECWDRIKTQHAVSIAKAALRIGGRKVH